VDGLRRLPSDADFSNGVLLLFLTSIQMDRVGTLVCLSLPALFATFFQAPLAHWADRRGKKKLGYPGISLVALAFLGLLVAAGFSAPLARSAAVGAILLFTLGYCLYSAAGLR